jgi:hypothetical protein
LEGKKIVVSDWKRSYRLLFGKRKKKLIGREERVTNLESGKGKEMSLSVETCFGSSGNVFFWLNSKLTNYVVDGGIEQCALCNFTS